MSTNKKILISSNSARTIDGDMDELSQVISYVIDKYGKKLHADFIMDYITDADEIMCQRINCFTCHNIYDSSNVRCPDCGDKNEDQIEKRIDVET